MNRICVILLLLISTVTFGQTSEKYNSEYAEFYKAEDLYEKEQYGSAKKEFRAFIDELGEPNNPMQIKARYYEAMSALMLYNNDALKLLQDFISRSPLSFNGENRSHASILLQIWIPLSLMI